jgi:hypothetical protein
MFSLSQACSNGLLLHLSAYTTGMGPHCVFYPYPYPHKLGLISFWEVNPESRHIWLNGCCMDSLEGSPYTLQAMDVLAVERPCTQIRSGSLRP